MTSCSLLFFIRAAPAATSTLDITVAVDGSGNFTTVQAAVDSVPSKSADRTVIHIKPGVYKERVAVRKDKGPITLLGEAHPKSTVITWNYSAKSQENGKEVGTSGSYSVLVEANDFIAENITFENSAGEVGQAVALRTTGDRQTFRHCRMLGWQDTLYVHSGRQYFADCYIEGRTDFIFGKATAVFDHCEIHSKNGGFVTAAATPKESPFGLVFLDCKLTGEGAPAYLGRPWRPDAAVAFIRCELGLHIRPEGWSVWGGNENHKTARYSEYRNTGPGADRSKRVEWSKELSDDEAAKYTVENIFAGSDGWKP